ncbi:MAG TPA: MFS transporter, partial [Candidatus Acidoferrum sp.]|nr:MFS transporter [Candidatus Acidoferrum sp.]
LGGTPLIIGIMEFSSFIALASVQFLGGYLADKHGRRDIIVTFTFAIAFANLFCALAPSWHFLLFGIVLQNIFLIYQPALQAIVADSIPTEKRGMGFSTIMLVNNAATVFSPIIAGVLCVQYGLVSGMRIAYALIVSFYLLASLVRTRLTETLATSNNKPSLKNAVREYPSAVREGVSVWKKLPRVMFYLFLTNAASSFVFMMCIPYFVVYATDVLHIKEFTWAIIMAIYSASMILAALPSGKLSDKIGRKKPALISWVLLAFFAPLFLLGGVYALTIGFLCFGVSNALFASAYQSLEADLVPRELRGKEVGCSQFITYTLMSVGSLMGGIFYESFFPALPFVLAFIVTIPCALITMFLVHEPKLKEA